MEIILVGNHTSLEKVKQLAQDSYGEMVKAVADIDKEILAIGGEFHADAEKLLLEQGSLQQNVWGFNIYPDLPQEQRLEFYSLINIRPHQNNRSQIIQDESIKQKITSLVEKRIQE